MFGFYAANLGVFFSINLKNNKDYLKNYQDSGRAIASLKIAGQIVLTPFMTNNEFFGNDLKIRP